MSRRNDGCGCLVPRRYIRFPLDFFGWMIMLGDDIVGKKYVII